MAKNDFRDEAARALNEQREEIIASLLALTKPEGGTRKDWRTIRCKHCNRDGKYEVEIPTAAADPSVAIRAIEALDKMGFGKPGDTQDTALDTTKDPALMTPTERARMRISLDAALRATAHAPE